MNLTGYVVTMLLLVSSQVAAAGDKASPLTSADFSVAGLADGMNADTVRRVLGSPRSVTKADDVRDPGTKLVSWVYRDLVVMLGSENAVRGVLITGPRVATARGLRAGEPKAKALALYGAPVHQDIDLAEYSDPGESMHVVRVIFRGSRVKEIFVGWVVD